MTSDKFRLFRHVLIVLLFTAAITINVVQSIVDVSHQRTSIYGELRFIIAHPRLSYDEKMHNRLGRLYDLARFTVEHTERDARVLLPASMDLGGITTYLLYPRRWRTYSNNLTLDGGLDIDYVVVDKEQPITIPGDVLEGHQVIVGRDDMSLVVIPHR